MPSKLHVGYGRKISSEDKKEKEFEGRCREWRQKSKSYREVGKKKEISRIRQHEKI